LRPRPAASSITSRYGSHALAEGARPGRSAAEIGFESVDTTSAVAGFASPESVDTPSVVAGFGGHTLGLPPAGRTTTPAARRYPPAVSRRTPVSASIRRSDHPSRPSATTCCLLSSLKTFAILAPDHRSVAFVNVSERFLLVAGFQVSISGRFWVSTEGTVTHEPKPSRR